MRETTAQAYLIHSLDRNPPGAEMRQRAADLLATVLGAGQ